jgi:hypothetical protein
MLRALYLDVAYVIVTMLQVFDRHFVSVVSGYVAYVIVTMLRIIDIHT